MKPLILFVFLFITTALSAQKLPDVQQTGLGAPAYVKIDGKATEWNNTFKAANTATGISYTIANDETRLYLVVQSADQTTAKKIIGGGITLTVNKSGEKNEKNAPEFTFPLVDKDNKRFINYKNPNGTASIYPDSMVAANNKDLLNMLKMIKVSGVSGVDTLVSIYNDKGVSVAALFNNKMLLIVEIAIDLKLLNLTKANASSFLYHIQLNAVPVSNLNGITVATDPNGGGGRIQVREGGITGREMNELTNATDFWGQYKLVTK